MRTKKETKAFCIWRPNIYQFFNSLSWWAPFTCLSSCASLTQYHPWQHYGTLHHPVLKNSPHQPSFLKIYWLFLSIYSSKWPLQLLCQVWKLEIVLSDKSIWISRGLCTTRYPNILLYLLYISLHFCPIHLYIKFFLSFL